MATAPFYNSHEHTRRFHIRGDGNKNICKPCAEKIGVNRLSIPTDAMAMMMGMAKWPTGKEKCDECGSEPGGTV